MKQNFSAKLSAIRNPQSAIRNPQSAIRNPQSAIRNPQSAIRNPQSAIRNLYRLTPLFQKSRQKWKFFAFSSKNSLTYSNLTSSNSFSFFSRFLRSLPVVKMALMIGISWMAVGCTLPFVAPGFDPTLYPNPPTYPNNSLSERAVKVPLGSEAFREGLFGAKWTRGVEILWFDTDTLAIAYLTTEESEEKGQNAFYFSVPKNAFIEGDSTLFDAMDNFRNLTELSYKNVDSTASRALTFLSVAAGNDNYQPCIESESSPISTLDGKYSITLLLSDYTGDDCDRPTQDGDGIFDYQDIYMRYRIKGDNSKKELIFTKKFESISHYNRGRGARTMYLTEDKKYLVTSRGIVSLDSLKMIDYAPTYPEADGLQTRTPPAMYGAFISPTLDKVALLYYVEDANSKTEYYLEITDFILPETE